jgi:ubiquinol-cytochrome c reductase cytochrome b subunit
VVREVHGVRGRVFADRWSTLLGYVWIGCFGVVTVTGLALLPGYEPSASQVTYSGSYVPLQGVRMSRALESTLNLSLEVPGGLLLRQTHHWASSVMIAALVVHLLRIFFTGAFRRPRRLRWVLLFLVLATAMFAGLTGHALPDDLHSGTTLVILDAALKSVPLVGTRLSAFLSGDALGPFYVLHVAVLPVLLVLLAVACLGPRGTRRPIRRAAIVPLGLGLVVAGCLTLLGATATVNPVWLYGPADPADATAGAAPLWYLAFLDGALRLVPPGWELVWLDRTWTLAVLLPIAACTAFLALVAAWPFLESRVTGDRDRHDARQRPRDHPVRTGLGVAGMAWYGVLWAAAGSDAIATRFGLSVEDLLVTARVLLLAAPVAAFLLTRRTCLDLRERGRDRREHGTPTGRVVRRPDGGYEEIHRASRARSRELEPVPTREPEPDRT